MEDCLFLKWSSLIIKANIRLANINFASRSKKEIRVGLAVFKFLLLYQGYQ